MKGFGTNYIFWECVFSISLALLESTSPGAQENEMPSKWDAAMSPTQEVWNSRTPWHLILRGISFSLLESTSFRGCVFWPAGGRRGPRRQRWRPELLIKPVVYKAFRLRRNNCVRTTYKTNHLWRILNMGNPRCPSCLWNLLFMKDSTYGNSQCPDCL